VPKVYDIVAETYGPDWSKVRDSIVAWTNAGYPQAQVTATCNPSTGGLEVAMGHRTGNAGRALLRSNRARALFKRLEPSGLKGNVRRKG
jgi:hypothetical protein